MRFPNDVVVRKLQEHSNLSDADIEGIRRLPARERRLMPAEDVIRQGDRPTAAVVVLEGMLARYHGRRAGGRQYLSLHIRGDMPDAQGLFLDRMDHGVCALDHATVLLLRHRELVALTTRRPSVGIAIWRETLIDAAIFREAITNNSGRTLETRLAHLFCEQYYRALGSGCAERGSTRLPLTQTQLGELLGASLPSITRAMRALRRTNAVEFRTGKLQILNWVRLVELGDFDRSYLHPRKLPRGLTDVTFREG